MLRVHQPVLQDRTTLRLHEPPVEDGVKWLINGFPATITTWTPQEWNRLKDKPKDAQLCPNGVWVSLRME